ncbi:MAG: T9SS type A sorting domain-containing protein [Bacteroidota bacterium]
MKAQLGFMLLLVLLLPCVSSGQEAPLVLPDWTASGNQYLNAQIAADTAANGWVANRVYVLNRNGIYYVNALFRVDAGRTLKIRSDYDGSKHYKPTIYLYPTGTGGNPQNPPGNFIDLRGNLYLKNIMLSGYFEPVDSNLNNLQGGLINIPAAGVGANMYIDSCILKSSNGNHIRTDGAPGTVKVTNTIIGDMGFLGRSNLGAGKGIDLRNVSVDTCIFQNCTFVNWQDRIIRHFQSTAPIKYLRFDHNTLVNGMSYHGMLSLGKVGNRAFITNNLFIDPFSLGNDTDATRQAEFTDSGEKDAFGNPRMTWVISAPNDTTRWWVNNNYYAISDSGQAFYNQFQSAGVTGEGTPLTYNINARLNAVGQDTTTTFRKITLTLTKTPTLMNVMNRWYRATNGGNKTKATTNFTQSATKGHWLYDYDRKLVEYYYDTLNCTYSTGSQAYTGAQGGYPVGDLNWFPSKKALWAADAVSDVPAASAPPAEYSLNQNYPNPFNPATTIMYTVPKVSNVRLELFDMLGRKVATLVNEMKQPGEYHVAFDASRLPSGIYIYRLSAPEQTISKKMTLLK